MSQRYFVILKSIHDVMAAEHLLVCQGLWCDMVPTPRVLSSDCGMAIEFKAEEHKEVYATLKGGRALVEGFFALDDGGAQSLSPPRR